MRADGRLDEPTWAQADAIDTLTMTEPREGVAPSKQTRVRVLADRISALLAVSSAVITGVPLTRVRRPIGGITAVDAMVIEPAPLVTVTPLPAVSVPAAGALLVCPITS